MGTINTRVVLRNDTKANWEAVENNRDLALLEGEFGVETDTGLFKIGKVKEVVDGNPVLCTWAELDYANEIPEVDLSTVTNHVKVVDGTVNDLGNGEVVGDMGIVRAVINGDVKSHTAYVWNGTAWEAMDGNYDADNVYFDSNLVMTANIGVQSLGSASSKDLNTAGKSLKQVLSMILAKEEKPTITSNPSVTTYIKNDSNAGTSNSNISVEAGTTVTPYWNAAFGAGAYSYGPATGITPTGWEVKGYLNSSVVSGHEAATKSGNFDAITLAAGDSYKINAKASYNAGPLAYTNLGEEYKAGNALFDETEGATSVQIAGGSKSDDSATISAWQQGYYIGTLESNVAITSNILRNVGDGKDVLKNRKVKGGNYAAVTDLAFSPTSDKMAKFIIAYPASCDMTKNSNGDYVYDKAKGLQSFFNNSSFEEYFGNFTREIVKVAGADNNLESTHAKDYAVWTWVPASAFSGTINFLIDLK